jgi:hypothetical protein
MTTTFQKRQKEMKRLDKAKAKAERRAQKKIEKRDGVNTPDEIDEIPLGPTPNDLDLGRLEDIRIN